MSVADKRSKAMSEAKVTHQGIGLAPFVRTRYGDGTHGLIFGSLEIRGLFCSAQAFAIAEIAMRILDTEGIEAATNYLKHRGAKSLHLSRN